MEPLNQNTTPASNVPQLTQEQSKEMEKKQKEIKDK